MIRRWLMTGLGAGYAPFASGTWGSAVALGLALGVWAVVTRLGLPPVALDTAWLILALLASIGCVAWGPWAIAYFADRSRKEGDPGQVVLDEWAGQWVALLMIPMPTCWRAITVMAVQFVLFRVFDVLKPPPGRRLEKQPGGWGIVLDDLVAGVYANVVGQIVLNLVLAP